MLIKYSYVFIYSSWGILLPSRSPRSQTRHIWQTRTSPWVIWICCDQRLLQGTVCNIICWVMQSLCQMSAWKIVSDKKTYRYILQNSGYLHCTVLYDLDHASFVSLACGDSKWKILTFGHPIKSLKDWKDRNCSHAHCRADVAVNQICIFSQ